MIEEARRSHFTDATGVRPRGPGGPGGPGRPGGSGGPGAAKAVRGEAVGTELPRKEPTLVHLSQWLPLSEALPATKKLI